MPTLHGLHRDLSHDRMTEPEAVPDAHAGPLVQRPHCAAAKLLPATKVEAEHQRQFLVIIRQGANGPLLLGKEDQVQVIPAHFRAHFQEGRAVQPSVMIEHDEAVAFDILILGNGILLDLVGIDGRKVERGVHAAPPSSAASSPSR